MSTDVSQLLRDLEEQKALMVAVSTGGPRIQEKNAEYRQRRYRIKQSLSELGIDDPNLFSDLWAWYGKWSSGELPSYGSRRKYIADLYGPVIDAVTSLKLGKKNAIPAEPTGWARVDRGVDAVWRRLEEAKAEEEFQAVGLLCREIIISLAQSVYDPGQHSTHDGVKPSETDGYRMLEAYFSSHLSGGSNETIRSHVKSSLKLAVELQHKRTASFRDAALCAEAMRTLVNVVAIVAGKR